MFKEFPISNNDRYYPSMPPATAKIAAKFNGRNPMTPVVTDLFETDDYYIEISCDRAGPMNVDCRFRGCTVIRKDGSLTDLNMGGVISRSELIEYARTLSGDQS